MAEAMFQQGSPVLDSFWGFANEMIAYLEKNIEKKYASQLRDKRQMIKKLKEETDELRQRLEVKDDWIKKLSGEKFDNVSKKRHDDSKLKFGELRPGAISHEDVQRQFTSFFTKYRRNCGSNLFSHDRKKYSIPSIILKLAYKNCKEYLLHHLNTTIFEKSTDICRVIENLYEIAKTQRQHEILFMDPRLVAMEELRGVFAEPDESNKTIDFWDEKKFAFFTLLNSTVIDKSKIVTEVKEVISRIIECSDEAMITEAADIAFSMVTLVPPAVIVYPANYIEDWVEPKAKYWKHEKIISSTKLTVYFRPTFFLSANGQIANKAEVGNYHEQEPTERAADDVILRRRPGINPGFERLKLNNTVSSKQPSTFTLPSEPQETVCCHQIHDVD